MSTMANAHALLVGIANYQQVANLPPTVLKDTQDIRNVLVDPQGCGYLPANVHLLLDAQATRSEMIQALAELARRSDEDSIVLFYISSHGGRIESGVDAGEYLLPVDVMVDTLVWPPKLVANTAISGVEFTEALCAIPARKVVIVFDCCHSGGIGHLKDGTALTLKSGLSDSYYNLLKAGRGRVILASSRSTEYSYVMPGDSNSLFTKHLLAGLHGNIPNDDGLIRIFDLFEYLQPKVTVDQPHQHPIFKAEIEQNFPVALNLGGQKGVVPKDEKGFRYDAYISYIDREPDSTWVWNILIPRLEGSGLRIAVSGDVGDPGVGRVVNIERGIQQSKRTVVVLSDAYLTDNMADFENVLAQTMGIQEGTYRLLPVKMATIDDSRLPVRLSMLTALDLAHPHRAAREFDRLLQALNGPLPHR